MKNPKIVLVAEWDGWCGTCEADRPLTLTRTGRQRLRTVLSGAADDSGLLLLTCRLCGTGVDVPLERDDPPVLVVDDAEQQRPGPVTAAAAPVVPIPVVPLPAVPVGTADTDGELAAGRQAVGEALQALLHLRTGAVATDPAAPAVPSVAPTVPLVPLQRPAAGGGLAELQLLADGIDLLGAGRPR